MAMTTVADVQSWSRVTRILVAAFALALAVPAASANAHYDYWHYELTGVQVMHWKATAVFPTVDGMLIAGPTATSRAGGRGSARRRRETISEGVLPPVGCCPVSIS